MGPKIDCKASIILYAVQYLTRLFSPDTGLKTALVSSGEIACTKWRLVRKKRG
jgi:hypothetical protein